MIKKFLVLFLALLVFSFSASPSKATTGYDISNVVITSGNNIEFDFSILPGDNVITGVGLLCNESWVFNPGNEAISFTQSDQHLSVTTSLYNGESYDNCRMYIYDSASANDYHSNQIFSVPTSNTPPTIADLIEVVEEMNLQKGIQNGLDAKLQSALDALNSANNGQQATAVSKLNAFINQVEGQRGNQLTNAQADQLIAFATNLINLLQN